MNRNVFGVAGWKNTGKTTLMERLVRTLAGRGWRVATVKHAHHAFDIDTPGTDSYRHRQAGAGQVAIVSQRRWAIIHELQPEGEPSLHEIIGKLAPCDLVLVEGYKGESHRKIETRRAEALSRPGSRGSVENAVAIAADHPVPDAPVPVFNLDDTDRIADFIERECGLKESG